MGLGLRLDFILSVYIDFIAYCYFNLVTKSENEAIKDGVYPWRLFKNCVTFRLLSKKFTAHTKVREKPQVRRFPPTLKKK